MNVYGRAMTDSKRQAHGKVVQMVLNAGTHEQAEADRESGPVANVV